MLNAANESFVSIGKIVKTRGNKGEVWVELLTDFPERFSKLGRVYLLYSDGRLEVQRLERFWFHKGRLIVKYQGIDSIAGAEKLINSEIQIPEDQIEKLPPGRYYDFQLIGCRVIEESHGDLGIVKEIRKAKGNDLLVVVDGAHELLIPVAEDYCRKIDTEEKQIRVRLPNELLHLNRGD